MQVQKDLHVAVQYFLNGELEPELIRKQVRELAEGGYKCIYGHARQGMIIPYLSENWWRAIDVIVEECESLGIKFAIWDEDYYPSPSAGNRVMWNDPSLASQQLHFTVFEGKKGRIHHTLEAEALLACFAVTGKEIRDISAWCGTVCDQWGGRAEIQSAYSAVMKVGAPHWRAWIGHRCFALDWIAPADCTIVAVQIQRNFESGHNADVLKAEAVQSFLNLTHEQYLSRYGQKKFDRVFAGTFMDEPAPWGIFPWTDQYPEEFKHRFGNDLIPLLPHLVLDIDENSRLHRLHYRDIQRDLLCRNYLATVQKWCAAHHICSIGHLTRTEHLSYSNYCWPDELYCCKYLDIPCTDPLGTNMGWPDTASYHTGLKVVSSAAYWYEKPQAGSDALAVCGSETDLRALRYMADYQMAFGITYFNLHGAAVSWAGPRKDEVPPSLFYQHTQWPLMKELWKHVDETCHRLAQGKEHISFVVYYPAAQFVTGVNGAFDRSLELRFHTLIEKLMSTHREFLLIDGVTLNEKDAELFSKEYPFLVISDGIIFFEPETEIFLKAYKSSGGRIIRANELDLLPRVELRGNGAENIFVHRRELPDGTLDTYLFNRSELPFSGTLEGMNVEVPPRSGCFADQSHPVLKRTSLPVGPWRISFEKNTIPLCRFATKTNEQGNLLLRRPSDIPEDGLYTTRFMVQGNFSSLRLIADAEMCTAPYKISLNDHELAAPSTGRFYDEKNLFYDLLPYLRTGSVPTQNILRIECAGELREMSYLEGDFTAEFRHGGCALPYLTASVPVISSDRLADWRELGYGTYSGCAVYETELQIPRQGTYHLSLGKVESAAEVFIDEKLCNVLYSAPYETFLRELAEGKHRLTLRIYNVPGNRDRLSGRPAGVLGPVVVSIID